MTMSPRHLLMGACLGLFALTAYSAFAEGDPAKYPTRPIHIIVGFAAGGGNDIIARIFGQKLSEVLASPSSSKTSRAAARSSQPNMSRNRRPTVTRC
jgi:tripartite-type tricarboxylate transporter receptor subunit TctC